MYCAFIDFRKAFDVVYRNGIWVKILRYGTSTKFTSMMRTMYDKVRSCVKINGQHTEFFESKAGVKQGEPLSPLLFLFFIIVKKISHFEKIKVVIIKVNVVHRHL